MSPTRLYIVTVRTHSPSQRKSAKAKIKISAGSASEARQSVINDLGVHYRHILRTMPA